MPHPHRKGASRTADIAPDVLAALTRGEIASATLTEGLAIDQARLLRHVFPGLPASALAAADAASELGILKRMAAMAGVLLNIQGAYPDGKALEICRAHTSDTVRGWACFLIAALPNQTLAERLQSMQPLADDAHFGVREWAWLALRPHLASQLEKPLPC